MKLIIPRAYEPSKSYPGIDYVDKAGPPGFQHIETAPKDGSWLRFRFRRVEYEKEVVGRWEPHAEMKTGGSWFDRDGCYITPGPLFWAPALSNGDRGGEA